MAVADWRKIFNIPEGIATDLVARIPNAKEIDTVVRKIQKRLPDVRPISRDQILRTYEALFDYRSGIMTTVFAGCLAAFAILAWDKATGLSADERRMIGILKATGWEVSHILELKFWEGFSVSMICFLSGVIGAHVHVFYFIDTVFDALLKGWSVLFPRRLSDRDGDVFFGGSLHAGHNRSILEGSRYRSGYRHARIKKVFAMPAVKEYGFYLVWVLVVLAACSGQAPEHAPVIPGTESLRIDLNAVNDGGVHFMTYKFKGKNINFFVRTDGSGYLQAHFDACYSCFKYKLGYVREENRVVCIACRIGYNLEDATWDYVGACAPINLKSRIVNEYLVIGRTRLERGERFF